MASLEGRKYWPPEATFHSLRRTLMTRHYYHENLTALKCAVAAIPTL